MEIAAFLARLDDVTPTGDSKWRAKCPAHHSRGRPLAIGESDTGSILVNCFAGCDVQEVVTALDLSVRDLFPSHAYICETKARESKIDYRGTVFGLYESLCRLLVVSQTLSQGQPLSADDSRLLDEAIDVLARVVGQKYRARRPV